MALLKITTSKIVEVPDWTKEEAAESTIEDWYAASIWAGDVSLDSGEWEPINYESVTVEVVSE